MSVCGALTPICICPHSVDVQSPSQVHGHVPRRASQAEEVDRQVVDITDKQMTDRRRHAVIVIKEKR